MSLIPVWTYAENIAGPGAFSPAGPEEAARVEKLADPARRQEILHARHLMRTLLAETYERQESSVVIHSFDDAPPRAEGFEDIAVSWSRSGPHALAACLPNGRLGVDLERIRPVRWKAMLDMIATPPERAALASISEEKTALVAFYRLWCAKEALLKWRGTGLRGGAKTVSVPEAVITGDKEKVVVTEGGIEVHLETLCPDEDLIAVMAFSD
ncbi:4'-phosphopantetheinyl transferase superfamily protein [Henriciella sp.]|uniref:4'-phosphopantetheinyl transferase family protein n=1 Tax=Henriciella sp. TaxID=1968823 RepID=UPI002607972B|nr:4'-phosphopantetheinyl transferase superfamily protein [Henriciella sp.]